MENQMLCYQCGLAKKGVCCNDTIGGCGKTAETSRRQDELTGALIGLAKASNHKSIDETVGRLIIEGLAATAAHTDFDDLYLDELTEQIRAAKTRFIPKFGAHNTSLKLPEDYDIRRIWQKTPEIRSLKSLLLFGIRGVALYARESLALGSKNKEAAAFFHKALIALGANHFKEDYYDILKELGGVALRAMEQAQKARQTAYGTPGPVDVPRIIDKGPFIIVSGHDFSVLAKLLEQTKDSGVNVYSHGELLPAHAYPEFRKYRHFKGHYGTGWQNQTFEFDGIPAAVVFTSGCTAMPLPSYADRVFTAGTARLPGCSHLEEDFTPALIRSIELGGAPEAIPFPGINGGTTVRTGFSKKTLRTVGYKLAAALSEGNLHRIYVIGGCDGHEEQRAAYTEMIRRAPDDAIVLTWGCAKYRFNDINYGEIETVPRIIDLGMCGDLPNVIALIETIAESARLRVDELPLTWHYTWQEQRSAAQFFALFAADIRDVVLGPKLPPYITEQVFATLAGEYGVSLLGAETPAPETETPFPAEPEPTKPEPEPEETRPEPAPEPAEEFPEELPAWAVMEEAEETEAEAPEDAAAARGHSEPAVPPEEIDQTPDFAKDDGGGEPAAEIPPEAPLDIEARSEAAGLPAWAVDDDEDDDGTDETETADSEYVSFTEIEPEQTAAEARGTTEAEAGPYTFAEEAPKIVLPKGKGVSGWKDPDDEDDPYHLSEKKPYQYTPPRELVEIEAPPPVALPPGAGVSGFAADKDLLADGGSVEESPLYSFAEPLPEIKIPKGKGVSGWKEGDDEFRPAKKSGGDTAAEKPWLKKSLERLHAEVEEDSKAAAPIPSAIDREAAAAAEAAKEAAKEAEIAAKNSEKPWLEASLKSLKESIAADQEEAAAKTGDKPWLQASLAALHAEVEADAANGSTAETAAAAENGDDEETYVSSYHHDEAAAAEKPWLKTSIEELKESIDRDAGIKSVRRDEKKAPAKEKTAAEAAEQWQDTAAPKSWKDIAPAASQPAPSGDATVAAAPLGGEEAPPSGGAEPPEQWQKPPVTPKPWDKDLSTPWHKPEVLPKPWQKPNPAQAATYAAGATAAEQQDAYVQQQDAYVQQQAAAEQQAAYAEQQAIAEQQAAYAEQQAMAEQQAAYARQQAMAEQQAAYAQQQAIAEEQRLRAARNELAEQTARIEAARVEQERYAAVLREQAYQIEEARRRQEAEAARIEQETARIREIRQQQERQFHHQSMRSRQEQAAYAAQLEQQAQQLRAARAAQESYRRQLEEEAARMRAAQSEQAAHAARLYQEEERLRREAETAPAAYPYAAEEPAVLPAGGGVSGFRQTTFVPGTEQPAASPMDVIRQAPPMPNAAPLPQNGGVSGSRYHEVPPPIQTDYSQTCYGVPQTPKVSLPQGKGTSGWSDPNPPQAATAPAGNFFGFMNSDAPAARSNTEIITPGSGDEFIATKTADGEVVVTVRTDKNK